MNSLRATNEQQQRMLFSDTIELNAISTGGGNKILVDPPVPDVDKMAIGGGSMDTSTDQHHSYHHRWHQRKKGMSPSATTSTTIVTSQAPGGGIGRERQGSLTGSIISVRSNFRFQ